MSSAREVLAAMGWKPKRGSRVKQTVVLAAMSEPPPADAQDPAAIAAAVVRAEFMRRVETNGALHAREWLLAEHGFDLADPLGRAKAILELRIPFRDRAWFYRACP